MDIYGSTLYTLKNCKSKRISSYDVTGGNGDRIFIKAGETADIANISGCGIIKHIWTTFYCNAPLHRRNIILRMYWDGEETPSVQSPLGDFFGQGWGETYLHSSLLLAAGPKGGRGLSCYFPMPFSKGARISIENDTGADIGYFYFYIDYEEHEKLPENTAYFHAWWNRELTEPVGDNENQKDKDGQYLVNQSDQDNYLIADIQGKGHFAGINYYVDNPTPEWYGEGDDMWMVDGEAWPGSLHGTGTEDFFNSAWCPNEVYSHPYFGYAKVPSTLGMLGRTHCYRYFIQDPVCFDKSLRFSIEHGHANALTLDISTVAYWYQTEPHRELPPVPGREKRENMPEITRQDVHAWRAAWRNAKGNGILWGNEK